jgi:hypothetical protein
MLHAFRQAVLKQIDVHTGIEQEFQPHRGPFGYE